MMVDTILRREALELVGTTPSGVPVCIVSCTMVWLRLTLRRNTGLRQGGQSSVSVEENKALVRRFLEEQARGNLDVIDELLSPDFVDRALLPGQGPTREEFKRAVTEILDAFSIIDFTIEADRRRRHGRHQVLGEKRH